MLLPVILGGVLVPDILGGAMLVRYFRRGLGPCYFKRGVGPCNVGRSGSWSLLVYLPLLPRCSLSACACLGSRMGVYPAGAQSAGCERWNAE